MTEKHQKTPKKRPKSSKSSKILKEKQERFLEIFFKNMGMVYISCEKANIVSSTYYEWLKNPIFAQKIDEINKKIMDFGESALYRLIQKGNPQAILFYNKTKNKHRGYIEKQEIEMSGKVDHEPVEIQIVYSNNEIKDNSNKKTGKGLEEVKR